jgi:hypothetical protein
MIAAVKSTDCGRKWSQPVFVGTINDPQAPGVAFRTPAFAFVSVDDTNPNTVYVAYQSLSGDYDVYVQRSTDGGVTWGAPAQVNEDPGGHHQIFPTIDVSNGALHVAWYDFRNSTGSNNDLLDVYYASNTTALHTRPSATMYASVMSRTMEIVSCLEEAPQRSTAITTNWMLTGMEQTM